MTPPESSDDRVTGEVYRIPSVHEDALFRQLDRYESVHPQDPQGGLFRREIHTVTLEGGNTLDAWIYLFNPPVRNATHISSGDYLVYKQSETQ